MQQIRATPNGRGQYRIFGWGTPARVWIGTASTAKIFPDTIISLTDAHGNTDEALAKDVMFDKILSPV